MWPNNDNETWDDLRREEEAWENAKATDGEALSGITAADNETARAKPTPRVEARLIAREYGLNGDNSADINKKLRGE